mmetsp:Transcript_29111/g.45025  ORF Transcript_29111/g.45025 Transcript_29111/m.45025 type:complete len:242 (-) Transcript_29111:62-787(-)
MPEKISLKVGEPLVIESMCSKCQGTGQTRMLMVNIPHFKELLVSSFECLHCPYFNRSVAFIGAYDSQAKEIRFNVVTPEDLNTQVILSSYSRIEIPCLNLEIPPRNMEDSIEIGEQLEVEAHGMGSLTTIEGVLHQVNEDISRKVRDVESKCIGKELDFESNQLASALIGFLSSLNLLIEGKQAFTFVVHDISGNSFISPINIDSEYTMEEIMTNEKISVHRRPRTFQENIQLGLSNSSES